MRTRTEETAVIQDPAPPNHQQHTAQEASSKRQTEQKYKPDVSGQGHHLTQPCPSEEKHTKTQHKSHPVRGLHKPLGQP